VTTATTHDRREKLKLLRADPVEFRRVLYVRAARGLVRFGEVLADFQRRDFEILDQITVAIREDREPVPRKCWIERTKGASKSSDIAVALLWLLFAADRLLLIQVAAGDGEQAREVFRAIRAILKIRQNAWLKTWITLRADRIINAQTETTIEFLTADSLGSHGARVDLLCIDEVSHAKAWEFIETIMDNSAKMAAGGLICGTNAGLIGSPAHALREVARQSPDWAFSAYTNPAPWLSMAEVAERRRLTSPGRFRRLWAGQWTHEAETGLNPEWIADAIRLAGPGPMPQPGWAYFVGADLGLVRDNTSVVTLGIDMNDRGTSERNERSDGQRPKQIHLVEHKTWKPKPGQPVDGNAVRAYLRRLCQRFSPQSVNVDPTEARILIQDLRREGLQAIEEYTFSSPQNRRDMAASMLSAFRERSLLIYRDDELIDELHRLEFVDKLHHHEIRADRDARGHCDTAISLAIALVPAIKHLRFGCYSPPTRMTVPVENGSSFAHSARPEFRHGVFLVKGESSPWG
jgi:hypothetical protein